MTGNRFLWQEGRTFQGTSAEAFDLLLHGETYISMELSPNSLNAWIEKKLLPAATRVCTFSRGTIANANFLAVSYNGPAKAGALVTIDFLLSPEAQARKQLDPFGAT